MSVTNFVLFKSSIAGTFMDMIKSLHPKFSRVVVSVCSGRSEMEMNSRDLCVCLDVHKRSLFVSAFAHHYMHKKRNVVFRHHDMANGLLQLFTNIYTITKLPMLVLFQHPSPSLNHKSRVGLSVASRDCVFALTQQVINSVHFVYDAHRNTAKNFWHGDELKELSLSLCKRELLSNISVSCTTTISPIDATHVKHPIFGHSPRNGWALMKKGCERIFSIRRV